MDRRKKKMKRRERQNKNNIRQNGWKVIFSISGPVELIFYLFYTLKIAKLGFFITDQY